MTQINGLSSLILVVFLIFSVCAVFCYLRTLRRRHMQHSAQRRSHSMVYSVTMEDGNGASFYNSVTEYLRNSQIDQLEQSSSTRQRLASDDIENSKVLTPKGLPSYDDVVSGKFDGNVEPPPPYSESRRSNLETERPS